MSESTNRQDINRQDTNWQEPYKACSDNIYESKHNPSLGDIYALLGAMQRQLDSIENTQASQLRAFVKNDLGEPDYDGHRVYHTKSNKDSDNLNNYKTSLTTSLLDWFMKAGITIICLGLLSLLGSRLSEFMR